MSIRNYIYPCLNLIMPLFNRVCFRLQKDDKELVVFDTSLKTDNLGDHIIMKYCGQALQDMFPNKSFRHISTHSIPQKEEERMIQTNKYKFVCGTNLLTSHIESWWNWRLPEGILNKLKYRNVILLGVGWGNYQDACSLYSKCVYRCLLNPEFLHAVRDQYTLEQFQKAGIRNVINTGCPTMWQLTPEFCKEIPRAKAENVVTTITDYRQDPDQDNQMLSILSRNYKKVYLWLQGKKDEEYLSSLCIPDNMIVLPRDLNVYEDCLNSANIDYIGTRLHAGIWALNHKVRSIIIGVDNRAIEIAHDTKLPMILRTDIEESLEKMLRSNFETEICIPADNIGKFLKQFL